MKTIFAIAAAVIALAVAAAQAQTIDSTADKKTPLQKMDEEKKRDNKQADKDYQAALKRKANADAPAAVVDPWANVRSGPTPVEKKK